MVLRIVICSYKRARTRKGMNVRWTFIGRSLGLAGKTADSLWRIRQAPDGVPKNSLKFQRFKNFLFTENHAEKLDLTVF